MEDEIRRDATTADWRPGGEPKGGMRMASLTVENYLKAIYQICLAGDGKSAATGEVAQTLEVAPGTVTSMLKTLAESGLANYMPYEGASLTPAGAALAVEDIVLAAFNSLDDTVTIDDLALAMEERVTALGAAWTMRPWAIVCHSTGALIARRWLLNRLAKGPIPTHFVTMAGANHGSTLAQMGKSPLGYVQKLFAKQSPTVGANVLTDLDYGSDFLLKLNSDWMTAWNDGSLDGLWTFSMGGDFVGNDKTLDVFWETHEPGSDNTVRISGANLNYTLLEATLGVAAPGDPVVPVVTAVRPTRPVPHLVLHGYSHFGSDTGILGWTNPAGDFSVQAVVEALSVQNASAYADLANPAVANSWAARTQTWSVNSETMRVALNPQPASAVNSTGVFTIRDESGRSIDDCVIVILDNTAPGDPSQAITAADVDRIVTSAMNVSESIMSHSPIQNNVHQASYSFYFDYNEYTKSSPHWFHIEAALPGLVTFIPLTFTQPASLAHTIYPNEFTYLSLTMKRDTSRTYAVYQYGPGLNLPGTSWLPMPFPVPGRISP